MSRAADSGRRERLLDLAREEFVEHGFERASLNAILDQAAISKGVFYHHFEDKGELYCAVLSREIEAILAAHPVPRFDEATAENYWKVVDRSLRAWARALSESPGAGRLVRDVNRTRRKSPKFAPILARGEAMVRGAVEAGQRLGVVRRDVPVEMLVRLVAAADHALDQRLFDGGDLSSTAMRKHVALLLDTFRRLLSTAESPA